ncbi:MAG: glycogen synthase GlgA [Erysipelotrichaceae bacterium]|nr:glycogen synthase GlgA [Erysipelotrichaceae bacterium]
MKSILFVAGEGLPFVKSGGLADVIGSLPKTLAERGYDVRIVLPLYKSVIDKHYDKLTRIGTVPIHSGWIDQPATYYYTETDGVTYYFIEHRDYFERVGLYGFPDDGERFSFFQRAALDLLYVVDWFPDIIHSHDWHTGMIPLMCKVCYGGDDRYQRIKHVYTIHNLAFQGNFPPEVLGQMLGIDYYFYDNGSVRFDTGVSFMKSGIVFADKVTTVSPTYAQEILTPEFGERMDEVLRFRREDLWGIVNGIDTDIWNPKTDELLAKNYDLRNYVSGKRANKKALQEEMGLEVRDDVLLMGMVTRLTKQKGVTMITERLREIMGLDLQFVILGSGETDAENAFKWLESEYKGKAVYYAGYNEELAHRIYASSDLFLMPSMYEPCGISQLISMRYGTLPLVRETGGLKDTVNPYNQYTQEGNGFSFYSKNPDDMMYILRWITEIYYNDKPAWKILVKNAFNTDVSWNYSADLYEKLYWEI